MKQSSIIFLDQVRLRTEVLRTPGSTRLGFELMTSRSFHVTETPALPEHLLVMVSAYTLKHQVSLNIDLLITPNVPTETWWHEHK